MDYLTSVGDTLLGLSAKADELSWFQVAVRAVTVYIILIGYIRFGKKRFLGEATAFDAILVIVIGSVASRAISGTAPFVPSMVGTFTLILFHWIASYLVCGSSLLSYALKGRDTLLVKNGRVDWKALRASHMTKDDLDEDLRQKGVDSPSQVKTARLERCGRVSVIKK